MTRNVYSPEFKHEAAQLVTAGGVSVGQVANDLDVHTKVLHRWVREAGPSGPTAFMGKGQMKPEDEELRNLRREEIYQEKPQSVEPGVSETLCMRLSPCEFGGSFVELFWV